MENSFSFSSIRLHAYRATSKLLSLLLLFSISYLMLSWGQTANAYQGSESKDMILDELGQWSQSLSERDDLDPREKDLRVSFVNRLISQTEEKLSSESNDNLENMYQIIKGMAKIDQSIENKSRRTSNAEFTVQLAESLRTLIEPRENLVAFIKSFTEFSGLSEPAKMEEFAATRNYSDGKDSYQAEAQDYETIANSVADIAETMLDDEYQMAKAENGPDQADTIDLMLQNSSNP